MKSHRAMYDLLVKLHEHLPEDQIKDAFGEGQRGIFVPVSDIRQTYGRVGFKVIKTERQTQPLAYEKHIETWILLDMAKRYTLDNEPGIALRPGIYL